MQLILIALAIGIYIHDGVFAPDSPPLIASPALLLTAALAPKAVLALAYFVLCRHTLRRLKRADAHKRLRRLDRLTGAYGYAMLALYGVDLWLGLLRAIRGTIGNLVLVDELAIIGPTLLAVAFSWWCFYPIDRRLRQAATIAQVDAGLPIYPIWTRSQYLVAQLRHQVALILAPLLLIMAWSETVRVLVPDSRGWLQPVLVTGGAFCTFFFAPVMLRRLWDTVPLPEGELRDMLAAMCRRHRVKVRELLLWRTYGGMINAAVMGVAPPVRYILLSDALLDLLRRDEVEAVMAHELAHVRRRHMFWLLAAAITLIGLLEVGANLVIGAIPWNEPYPYDLWGLPLPDAPTIAAAALFALGAAMWIGGFGWVSRRIERQADTFAVQHLAREQDPTRADPVIDSRSAGVMVAALGEVARLNHMPANRRSWRHGSIATRQDYLRNLVGTRASAASVDREMTLVKLAIIAGGVLAALGYAFVPLHGTALLLAS